MFLVMQFPNIRSVTTDKINALIDNVTFLAKYKSLIEPIIADGKLLLLGMILLAHIGLSLFGEIAGPNLGGNGSRSRSAFTNWGR